MKQGRITSAVRKSKAKQANPYAGIPAKDHGDVREFIRIYDAGGKRHFTPKEAYAVILKGRALDRKEPKVSYGLPSDQYDRLGLLLEQIAGLNEMLFLAMQNEIEKSTPGMAAWKIIEDKTKEAAAIVNAAVSVKAKK
jgi:hypothetical protein